MTADFPDYRRKLAFLSLKKSLRGKAGPANLFLSLTDRCDLNCLHCYYRDRKRRLSLSFGTAKNIIRQARENGIPQVTFFGGEPSLYPRLAELAAYADGLGLFTELDTNGQSLGRKELRELSRAGLSSVMVSLHSETPGEHDRLTGKTGSHKRALKFIKDSLKAGLLCYVSACFFKGNYNRKTLKKFAAFTKKLGAHGIRSLFFYDNATLPGRPILMAGDIKAMKLEDYVGTCFSSDPGRRKCSGSLNKMLYVGTGGEVKSCPYSRAVMGNIRKTPLFRIIPLAKKVPARPVLPCAG